MKLFSKIATLSVGLALAIGVGVAAASPASGEVKAGYEATTSFAVGDIIVFANDAAKKELNGVVTMNKVTAGEAVDFSGSVPNAVFPLTVESGTSSGSYAFRTSAGKYLSWSDGNSLSTADAVSTASSWTVVDVASKGQMLQNVGTTARHLSYNPGSPRFATYGNTNQNGINFYKYVDDGGTKYTVSYNANGGQGTMDSTVASSPVIASSTFTAPSGKKFGSWNTNASGTGDSYNPGTSVSKDLTLYAIWVDIPSYTCAEAISAIDNSGEVNGVYVSGYVTSIYTDSGHFSNGKITYWMADTVNGGNQFEAYLGLGLNGEQFKALTDIEVGAFVKVFGNITKYNTTYEFSADNYLVTYTPPVAKTLESIKLSGTYQTTFELHEEFSYDGLIVTAHYDDESSKEVTPTSVSTPDMTTLGNKTVTVSYTEGGVTKTATYPIQVHEMDPRWTVSFIANGGSGSMDPVEVKEGEDYKLPACTFTAPEGKVFDHWEVYGEEKTVIESIDDDYEVTVIWKDKPAVSEVSDVLNNGNTISKVQTTYEEWTTATMDSGAVYSGQSGGDKTSIQLRTNGNNSGVVSTTSGGDLVSVTISFNTETSKTRTVSIYGSTNAYSAPTDLYNSSNQGTLLGEVNIDDGAEQTIIVEGSYQYVGFRSKSGALYLDSVTITWNSGAPTPSEKVLESIAVSNPKIEYNVGDGFVKPTVTATYDSGSPKVVTDSAKFDGFDSSAAVESQTITVSYTEGGVTKTTTYVVSISAPVGAATYRKVTSELADYSGDYLLVYEDGNVAFDGSLATLDAENNNISVSISDGVISASEASEFHIAKRTAGEGYSLSTTDGKYVGQTSYANGLKTSDSDDYDIAISVEGGVASLSIAFTDGPVTMKYNKASNQNRFRFYKSGQESIALYRKVTVESVEALILSETNGYCSSYEETDPSADIKALYEAKWTLIKPFYDVLSSEEKAQMVSGSDEALTRYDHINAKYSIESGFISGRAAAPGRYVPTSTAEDSNVAIAVVAIVAVASISAIAVILIIKRRKAFDR